MHVRGIKDNTQVNTRVLTDVVPKVSQSDYLEFLGGFLWVLVKKIERADWWNQKSCL